MFLQFEKTEKKTKILYYKHMNSRKRSSCKGDSPELLQMSTRVRSLCSLICLHLFKLSAKDRLLSPTRLQRLTNPKKVVTWICLTWSLLFWGILWWRRGVCVDYTGIRIFGVHKYGQHPITSAWLTYSSAFTSWVMSIFHNPNPVLKVSLSKIQIFFFISKVKILQLVLKKKSTHTFSLMLVFFVSSLKSTVQTWAFVLHWLMIEGMIISLL